MVYQYFVDSIVYKNEATTYGDKQQSQRFKFIVSNGGMRWYESDLHPGQLPFLAQVDTFDLMVAGDSMRLHKYEPIAPNVDGEGCYLFTKELGLIGISSYNWHNTGVMTKCSNPRLNEKVKALNILLSDSSQPYFKRSYPLPPPVPEVTTPK